MSSKFYKNYSHHRLVIRKYNIFLLIKFQVLVVRQTCLYNSIPYFVGSKLSNRQAESLVSAE